MKTRRDYTTLELELIDIDATKPDERALINDLLALQKRATDWNAFGNEWMHRVAAHYKDSGLTRRQITETVVWRIAQDLDSRLGIRLGLVSPPDYREELRTIIEDRFHSQKAFCEATGISEDMLSHVLAHRKHLAIDTLSTALERIGYRLHIAPVEEMKS